MRLAGTRAFQTPITTWPSCMRPVATNPMRFVIFVRPKSFAVHPASLRESRRQPLGRGRRHERTLLTLSMTVLFVLFHNSQRGHFFGALAIATGRLSTFVDIFVLALLLRIDYTHVIFSRHIFPPAQDCPELSVLASGFGVNAANGRDC